LRRRYAVGPAFGFLIVKGSDAVSDRLLTAAELAELLGFAAGTIVDWAEKGRSPPSSSAGGCVLGSPKSSTGSRRPG
jgi:hypothetical protein